MSALNTSVVFATTRNQYTFYTAPRLRPQLGPSLFQWGVVPRKKNTSKHHHKSRSCNTVTYVVASGRGVKYLSLSIYIIPQLILWKKAERADPSDIQSWPLQLIEHLTTISVAPHPASPAGCRPLYLLHLLNLSFTTWATNRCFI